MARRTFDLEERFRYLPTTVIPNHYALELEPDLENLAFQGHVEIDFWVKVETYEIILNGNGLKAKNAEVVLNDGQILTPKSIHHSEEVESIELAFGKKLTPEDKGRLTINFTGKILEAQCGLFRNAYKTLQSEERFTLVTQFMPTDARRCFPCWDEPAIKATFDITLIVPAAQTALSNMPVLKAEKMDDDLRQRVIFERTPIMSTYLVAFVIGEYDFIESQSKNGTLLRVYVPHGLEGLNPETLDMVYKILSFYNKYFGYPYPLPKLDIVSVPDFHIGAMENWGLVTVSDTYLVIRDGTSGSIRSEKQSTALTIAHELAHQWFGNLVTMEWWTDLWLHEGFCTFLEYLCVDDIFPEFNIWIEFLIHIQAHSFRIDSLQHSHPIAPAVPVPGKAPDIFDEINCHKGASLVCMLYNYAGKDDFRTGMRLYLTRHQYRTTIPYDLWAAIQAASYKPTVRFMNGWTKLTGYPVVTVEPLITANYSRRLLRFTQTNFFNNGGMDPTPSIWEIPINIQTSRNPSTIAKTFMLDQKVMEVLVDNIIEERDWIKVNCGQWCYYRTRYHSTLLSNLKPGIRDMVVAPLDRASLMDDMFYFVRAGLTSTVDLLELIVVYRNDDDLIVWTTMVDILSQMHVLLFHTNVQEHFNRYGENLFRPIANKVGWEAQENENPKQMQLRALVLARLVSFRCQHTIAKAKTRFHNHISGKQILPEELRPTCYKAVLMDADEYVYNQMVALYRSSECPMERERIALNLGCMENEGLLKHAMELATTGGFDVQDGILLIASVSSNPYGTDLVWEFFKSNNGTLQFLEKFRESFLLPHLVKYLFENFTSEERAQDVENFFREHPFAGTENAVSAAVDQIRTNTAWLKRDLTQMTNWLIQHYT